jgi:hypothetical protein
MKDLGFIHRDFPYQEIAVTNALRSGPSSLNDSRVQTLPVQVTPTPDPPIRTPIVTEHSSAFEKLIHKCADLFDGHCTQMKSANYQMKLENPDTVSYGPTRELPLFTPALKSGFNIYSPRSGRQQGH